MFFILVSLLLGFTCATTAVAQTAAAPEQPRVALIGDSIRMGYAPLVARRLAGRVVIISPEPNGEDSSNVLRHLEEWVLREKPDVIHLNAGLHDLKKAKGTGAFQVGIDDYERNLREIVRRIRAETGAALVFASTTPIHDERHSRRGADFNRHEADVRRYNDKALQVMRELVVPVNDLHWIVEKAGPAETLASDGVHYTPAGYERLAEAVADCILRQLIIRRYTPLPAPPAGPTATEAYRKTEIERDALVPAPYRDARIPELPCLRTRPDGAGAGPGS